MNDEVKLMRKVYPVCIISLNFEVYFLQFLQEVDFSVIQGNHLYLWLSEIVKNDC